MLEQIQCDVIRDVIEYYCELGDVQTSVSIAIVVNHVVEVDAILGKDQLVQLYMHYINLLHQLRLYTVANLLISKCTDSSISQMNMKATSIYINCSECSKPLDVVTSHSRQLYTQCRSEVSICSLCQLSTKGLFVWCPSCSHGGHLYLSCLT